MNASRSGRPGGSVQDGLESDDDSIRSPARPGRTPAIIAFTLVFLASTVTACGGTKVLKEEKSLVIEKPLATATDEHLQATLDWVIFRDGPGTWAKNADWDEYLMRVENLGDEQLEISEVAVVDSLGTRIAAGHSRSQLVKGTKQTKRRYRDDGIDVKAGLSGTVLVGAGVLTAAGTSGLGAAAVYGGSAVAAGALAVVALVPVLTVGGVVRGVNNSNVNSVIESRQTLFPSEIGGNEEKAVHVFFPLAPSPQRVELTYTYSGGVETLTIDTGAALEGLHLAAARTEDE